LRVAGDGELDLAAVGFEAEGGVGGGLFLDAFEGVAGALGFDDTAGLSVGIEDIVGSAGVVDEFAEGGGFAGVD
jgi:hypothetical protein